MHQGVVPLNNTGYGETAGLERIVETFKAYLAANDQNPSRMKATDEQVSHFLDFFLQQQGEGGVLGDTDVEMESQPDGVCALGHKCMRGMLLCCC
jgi:hypothetical protein